MEEDRFIREPEVKRITGLSRTTRWRLERKGKFPPRRQLSENAIGWLESEIRAWIASRTASSAPSKAVVRPALVEDTTLTGSALPVTGGPSKPARPLLTPTGDLPVDLASHIEATLIKHGFDKVVPEAVSTRHALGPQLVRKASRQGSR